MNNTVAIADSFLDSFARLPRTEQSKATEFMNKFRRDPSAGGFNYEKIQDAADKNIFSVRIDDAYRGIIARQQGTGSYIVLWVDHHDEAYAWARSKKCVVNKVTGVMQVYDTQTVVMEAAAKTANATSLFASVTDQELVELGLPEEQISLVRAASSLEEFQQLKGILPKDAYEGLEWLANGFPLKEVFDLVASDKGKSAAVPNSEDFAAALKNPRSQAAFYVVEGEDALRKILAEPLDRWRVFLHPKQRSIVEKNYSGAARVLGGAGTGKTVVAMHRAKYLASQCGTSKQRVLFTTFTVNLASDISENLKKICSREELERIDVINIDALAVRFLKDHGIKYDVVYNDATAEIWEKAMESCEDTGMDRIFFENEWLKVVCAQDAFTEESYVKARRIGCGTRLDRKKRILVWKVFEEYMNLLKEDGKRDAALIMYECRKILEPDQDTPYYSYIVADEGQDLSPGAFRLLRALAGEEHENDIFIVGDAHQRIYKSKASLSQCGINVRGRSSKLRLNYRTTEETRKYAFSLLTGIKFDDMDDYYDDDKPCLSLMNGCKPVVENFKNANEESEYILAEIKRLIGDGVNSGDICLVARTHKLLDGYMQYLNKQEIRTYEIKSSKNDERFIEGVRVATIHRVKGLEFQYVFIAAANNKTIPLDSAIDRTDKISETESITSEKCLLYVALTRARKQAYITSYGTKSTFLVN